MIKKRFLFGYRFISFCILFCVSQSLFSQQRWGLINSNMSGVHSLKLNPALMPASKLYMDVNLVSIVANVNNNYGYIPKEEHGLFSFLNTLYDYVEFYNDSAYYAPKSVIDFKNERYETPRDVFVFLDFSVYGPSVMYTKNDQSFGFSTAFRNIISVNNIPYDLISFIDKGIDYEPQLNIDYSAKDYGYVAASWLEYSFSYARVLHKYYRSHWSGGLTIKRLLSFGGSYLNVDDLGYKILDDQTLVVNNIDAQMGIAVPIDYSTNEYTQNGVKHKGKGIGFDIGVVYERKKYGHSNRRYQRACEQPYEEYIYRIGLSIMDIGKIKYTNNAQIHRLENSVIWEDFDMLDYSSVQQITQLFSSQLFSDSSASLRGNSFSIGLPTTLGVQFDWNYNDKWFFSSNLQIPIKTSAIQLKNPSQFMVAARYESNNFEVQMPIMLQDWKNLNVGFSVRYYFLTFGTDKLISFLGLQDLRGFDFYASVKFNLFKGKCRKKRVLDCN